MIEPRMTPSPLVVAISPCPNDSFIFGSWVLGQCKLLDNRKAAFIWADVQELNEFAEQGRFDVLKVSAAQALKLREHYAVLPAGGAFGTVSGPKLVARSARRAPRTIAVPGLRTTAVTLLRQAWTESVELLPVRYDRIVELVRQDKVDAGLLIHESALLLDSYGLECLLDLGQWWDRQSGGLPLPLGCIVGRRELGEDVLETVTRQIQISLDQAYAAPDAIWPLIRAMAQELDDQVLHAHIQAYVNAYSRDMGDKGRGALAALEQIALRQARCATLTAAPSPV